MGRLAEPTRHSHPWACAAVLLGVASLRAATEPAYQDGFERGLTNWQLGAEGKQPLVSSDQRHHSGGHSAYSGPPGNVRVGTWTFPLRIVGRVEVWFYDDMAATKHQMASVGAGEEFLGLVCRGGKTYQARVGMTYHDVPVARSEGWHLFAWECDGARTIGSIDGTEVFRNEHLGRLYSLTVGSYWDNSTGWYDDVKVWTKVPAHAAALVEGEDVYQQTGFGDKPIELQAKKGASGIAFRFWDNRGHRLDWAVETDRPGPATLLVRYAHVGAAATRSVELGGKTYELSFPATGAWDSWDYVGLPVEVPAGVQTLAMTNTGGGGCNVDWIALAPAGSDAKAYGALLDRWLNADAWWRNAEAMMVAAARSAGSPPPAGVGDPYGLLHLPAAAELATTLDHRADALRAARGPVLAAETAKLATDYQVQPHAALGDETPLSREVYHRLLRYVRLTSPRFEDWPHEAGCRYHKVDNHNEMAVRQNATVALGYAMLLAGSYDEVVAGVPREQIEHDLIALLRYLAITHDANFLPTGDGEPWGDQWQSAFWAGIAGHAAWLVWDELPADVKVLVARMVIHEADRFDTRPPDSGVEHDTKAEENAWNSEVIALADCMFPRHPHHDLWHERCIVYMFNSFVREADRQSNTVVDDRPVKERISAVTIHDDFTLENHNRVHPDYLSTGSLLLRNALLYRAAGRDVPESTFWNVPETYQVLKRLTAVNGSMFYVNGQDWWPHRHDVPLLMAGCMSVLRDDPEAAFLERAGLDFFGRMHRRFEDGRAWDKREYNYANAEEEMIARYAELYLLHRLAGDGPAPVARGAYLDAQSGVRVYDKGGFVTHRTRDKFASFAWVNGAMGLVFAAGDTWLTSPTERGLVGSIGVNGAKDTAPVVEDHRLVTDEDGFAVGVKLARCEGRVGQYAAMVSLPEGPVVYLERLVARQPVQVREVATGLVGILNEDAGGINPNHRTLFHQDGADEVVGASNQLERMLVWPGSWANVDGRLGLVTSRDRVAYRDRNGYSRARLEEDLIGNYLTGLEAKAGDELSASAVAILPAFTANATATSQLELQRDGEVLFARIGSVVVAADLGDKAASAKGCGRQIALEALQTTVWRP